MPARKKKRRPEPRPELMPVRPGRKKKRKPLRKESFESLQPLAKRKPTRIEARKAAGKQFSTMRNRRSSPSEKRKAGRKKK